MKRSVGQAVCLLFGVAFLAAAVLFYQPDSVKMNQLSVERPTTQPEQQPLDVAISLEQQEKITALERALDEANAQIEQIAEKLAAENKNAAVWKQQ